MPHGATPANFPARREQALKHLSDVLADDGKRARLHTSYMDLCRALTGAAYATGRPIDELRAFVNGLALVWDEFEFAVLDVRTSAIDADDHRAARALAVALGCLYTAGDGDAEEIDDGARAILELSSAYDRAAGYDVPDCATTADDGEGR